MRKSIGGIRFIKDASAAVLVTAGLALLIGAAVFFISTNLSNRVTVVLGSANFDTRLALTEQQRVQGLSGVTSLAEDELLLMAFPEDSQWSIWMKDMKIPIDIIWLDKDKKIVYMVKNADPALGTSRTFTPKRDARYVLEMVAGSIDTHDIRVNTTAIFDLDGHEVK